MALSKIPTDLVSGTLASSQLPAGSVLQVVQTIKTDAFTTTSATPVDITGLSASITPTSSSNKILVLAQVAGGSDTNTGFYLNLVRNSTSLALGTAGSLTNSTASAYLAGATLFTTVPIVVLDAPSTTAITTYKVQTYALGGGVSVVNRRANDLLIGMSSTITLMEIAA